MSGGKMNWEKVKRNRRRANDSGLSLGPYVSTGRCWCGKPTGHAWPGSDDGAPHPREEK